MLRFLTSLVAVSFFMIQPAFADDHGKTEYAEYGVQAGVSPFGGSYGFAYSPSAQTTWIVQAGGLPGTDVIEQEIAGITHQVKSSSSWMGFFLNHRPFADSDWFRLVGGIAFGQIDHELTDDSGNRYLAAYSENPVGYWGVGFFGQPEPGFYFGIDVGVLYSGGPTVTQLDGTPNQAVVEGISDSFLFGSVIGNTQFTFGYGW